MSKSKITFEHDGQTVTFDLESPAAAACMKRLMGILWRYTSPSLDLYTDPDGGMMQTTISSSNHTPSDGGALAILVIREPRPKT